MPIANVPRSATGVGNGVTTLFPFAFRILNADHVKVLANGTQLTRGVHYSVNGVGNDAGSILFVSPPANGVEIYIAGNAPYSRSTDYQRNGNFQESTVDADFDQLVILLQQIKEVLTRIPTLPEGTHILNSVFPSPVANTIIKWNGAGTALENASLNGIIADLSVLAASGGSAMIGHLPSGVDAVATTIYNMFERGSVSLFEFMSTLQENNVRGNIGDIDVSTAFQKAMDKAETTQRPVVGYGTPALMNTVNPYTSIWGIGGGQFEGKGLRFKWLGSANKVFAILGEDIQGWSFRNFRIDCQFVTTPADMMWFEQGLHGGCFDELCFRGAQTGPFSGGTYYGHNGIIFIGGDGVTSKYDVSQNKFSRIEFVRTVKCIEVTDSVPTGEAPGNSNSFRDIIAICNGPVFKSPGSNNAFENIEVYVDSGSGGHAFVMHGGNAFGWTFKNLDADGYSGAAGWEPIHSTTAGDVCLFSWDGGIIWPRSAVVPNPVLDAGTGTKGQRYFIQNVNNVDSTTLSLNAVKTAQGITTYGRNDFDGLLIDFTGTAAFSASGSMTVTSATFAPAQYSREFKMMFITLKAEFTLGGVASNILFLQIPGGHIANVSQEMDIRIRMASTWQNGIAVTTAGSGVIQVYVNESSPNWTLGSTAVRMNLRIGIQ